MKRNSNPHRNEIAWRRRTLRTQPSVPETVWKAVNSHFVIWFLSAILLTGMPWLVTKWIAENETYNKEKTAISRLDQEIIHRMSYGTSVAVQLQSFRKQAGGEDMLRVPQDNGSVILGRIFGVPELSYVLYPEFKERTLESLMRELSTYLPYKERACVLAAAHEVWEMSLRFNGIDRIGSVASGLQGQLEEVAALRWGFYALWDYAELAKSDKDHPFVAKCNPSLPK